MQEWLLPFAPTVLALGTVGALLLVQLLVADLIGIKAGHQPGVPVESDHDNLLFRASRAHANTNESIASFVLLALFGIFTTASPAWVNGLSWLYVSARLGHMSCYYLDLRLARSACFGVAVFALLGMFANGVNAFF